jgi:hypothetical protein
MWHAWERTAMHTGFWWKNEISGYRWEDNIKIILKESGQKDVDWIIWPSIKTSGMNLQVPYSVWNMTSPATSKRDPIPLVSYVTCHDDLQELRHQ